MTIQFRVKRYYPHWQQWEPMKFFEQDEHGLERQTPYEFDTEEEARTWARDTLPECTAYRLVKFETVVTECDLDVEVTKAY